MHTLFLPSATTTAFILTDLTPAQEAAQALYYGPAAYARRETVLWRGHAIPAPPLDLQLAVNRRRGLAERVRLIEAHLAPLTGRIHRRAPPAGFCAPREGSSVSTDPPAGGAARRGYGVAPEPAGGPGTLCASAGNLPRLGKAPNPT